MKRQERHKLKENEFARSVAHARDIFETRKRDLTLGIGLAVALLAVVGGYVMWQQSVADRASTLLGAALAMHEAPVMPPPAPVAGGAPPVQQPGTYPTERARMEAALPKFIEAADRYPNTDAGITARYHAAGILASLGRHTDAEQQYQQIVSKAGSSLYARTARLGLADAQAAQKKYDGAITLYTEISRDTSSQLPVDGVLMQLGRACAQAGRKEEAVRAFTRVVDEFPQSLYIADARRELELARKS